MCQQTRLKHINAPLPRPRDEGIPVHALVLRREVTERGSRPLPPGKSAYGDVGLALERLAESIEAVC